jgi:hypothetical protein
MATARGLGLLAALGAGLLALFAFGKAKAQPEEPPKEPDNGGDGGGGGGDLPPKPKLCNYIGCGPNFHWQHMDVFPTEASVAVALQKLGYVIASNYPLTSTASRIVVRQFQRDYNKARLAQTVDAPPPPSLTTDGWVGNHTIDALIRADRWTKVLNQLWFNIVALG